MRRLAQHDPQDWNEMLEEAARRGDLAAAKAAIKRGADAHITGDCLLETNNVITHAVSSGNEQLVEWLLRSGAECPNFYTEGPDEAVAEGKVRMLRAFLKYWEFEPHVYLEWLDLAFDDDHDDIYKLVLPFCPEGQRKDSIVSSKKERGKAQRAEAARSVAIAKMQTAPSSPPRKWEVQTDGIYIHGPWDMVLGNRLRDLHAKWLSPGWRVSLKHADAIAELFRDYQRLEAQRQELFQSARTALAGIPEPKGYHVFYGDRSVEASGQGNPELEALLNQALGCGHGFENGQTGWDVPIDKVAELAEAFRQHPPPPPAPLPPAPVPLPEPPSVTQDEARKALRSALMPMAYNCEITPIGIVVKGPFLDGLNIQLRQLKGIWNPDDRQWMVPLNQVTGLVQALRRFLPNQKMIAEAKANLKGIKPPKGYVVKVRRNGIFLKTTEFGLSPTLKNLGAEWDNCGGLWCFRPEQASALADLFVGLPAKVVAAKKYLAGTPMPNEYTYKVSPECIFVSGPKKKVLQERFLKRGGRWDPGSRRWWFQLDVAARLSEDLRACAAK